MYKALCVAALLWAMFALTTPTLASGLPSPVIVAKGKWTRQTAPIPTTTLFTPTQDGLYRLSIYATLTTADSSSQTYWYVNVFWTDDEGPQSFYDVLFA